MYLHNSLSRTKEEVKSIISGKIGLYVCGMTVYDRCHIGHARVFVVFDSFVRFLRAKGIDVKYIRNITDIDDKIVKKAIAENTSATAIVERYIDLMHKDERILGLISPDNEPRVSENIPQIIKFIEELIANGSAYATSSGNVYFSVKKYKDYGQLSNKNLEELKSNVRIQNESDKQDELDFALWKAETDEFVWDSPWGSGRPGWHIECSVMSSRYLGADFDIHGGGIDLLFPHHENERAQSCCNHSKIFANLWMHIGHLKISGEKMSKSLNNFITIGEIVKDYKPDTIRFFMLRTHYHSPLDYTADSLEESHQALRKLYLAIDAVGATTLETEHPLKTAFFEALENDFNTPKAIAIIFDILQRLHLAKGDERIKLASIIKECLITLGFLSESASIALWKPGVSKQDVEEKLALRSKYRQDKDYVRADAIRAELDAMGVNIKD